MNIQGRKYLGGARGKFIAKPVVTVLSNGLEKPTLVHISSGALRLLISLSETISLGRILSKG